MSNLSVKPSLPFGLEKVGKLNLDLAAAEQETRHDGLDKVFVSSGQDHFVLYGQEADFKNVRIGKQINFVDETGTKQEGTIKSFQDVDNTFSQGFNRTISSAFSKAALLAAPLAGGAIQLARLPGIKVAAADAAERAITPGTLRSIFDAFVRVPTHYPSAAEIAKARSTAIANVKPSTVILTGVAVGAAIGIGIPVFKGWSAAKNTPDESAIKDITGKLSLEQKINRALDRGDSVEDVVKANSNGSNQPPIIIIRQEKTVVVKETKVKGENNTLEHLETAGAVAKGVGQAGSFILKTLTHDHD
ncbi:MAG: hypothetical protein CVV27_00725 [Candidatus Melainabacteria bacterium HGW-Melainabacteria-1]|nr:MAG: hypothetical protein CVV27_00725 [Candidatus Melainabacteria bacterium HGW-Melainabacteria-1]